MSASERFDHPRACECVDCGTPWRTWATLFDHAPQPMWVFAHDTLQFLEVNRAAIQRYGYTRNKFLSMTLLDIHPADTHDRLANRQGLYSSDEVWQHRLDNGQVVPVTITAAALEWGGRSAYAVTVTDLSPVRAALDALERNAPSVRDVAAHIPQVFWIADVEPWRLVYVSPHFETMYGIAAEAVLTGFASMESVIHEDDLGQFRDAKRRQLHGEATVAQYRVRGSDGTERWIEDRAFPMRVVADGPLRIAGVAKDVTERRRAMQTLQLQKAALQAILETLPVMIAFFSADGRIVDANRCWEETLGWERRDLRRTDILGQLSPDATSAAVLRDFILAAGGEWQDFPMRTRSGRVVQTTWAAVRLPDGSVAGIGQDVTERVQTEQVLRESEARFRLMIESSEQVMFYLHDPSGVFEYVSPSVHAILGYRQEELCGLSYHSILAPGPSAATVEELTTTAIETAEPAAPYEVRALHRDGREVVLEVSEEPIVRDGVVVGMRGFARNITDRVAMEQDRMAAERRMQTILATVGEAIVIVGSGGDITYANAAAERVLGLRPSEISSRVYNDPAWHITAADGTPFAAEDLPVARVLATGRPVVDVEHAIQYPDGRRVVLSINAAPVTDSAGAVTAVIASMRDVTERRLLEEQLRHSQKMEAVGRLAGGIAHDFNNVLTSILGYSDLLFASFGMDDPRHEDLLEIRRGAHRARELTQQLLAFSRKQVVQLRLLDLGDTVTDLRRMLLHLVGDRIALSLDLQPGLWPIRADRGQIEQVIMNLVINARDAMTDGGRLRFHTRNVSQEVPLATAHGDLSPGEYVLLEVADSGAGIPPDVLPHVFEPFFTTKANGQGTGLGLAIVYGIVAQNGGAIAVQTSAESGTAFSIYLPRAFGTVEASPAELPFEARTGNATVLVVEDEPGIRSFVRRVLTGRGYQVVEAPDVHVAQAVLEQRESAIDLVITDIVMPGMSGRELVQWLARQAPELPVICMSGYSQEILDDERSLPPDTPFMEKPFSATDLLATVQAVLDRSPPRR